jgi:hypothetical protein
MNSHYCGERASAVFREVKRPGRYFSVAALWQPAPCRIIPSSVIEGERTRRYPLTMVPPLGWSTCPDIYEQSSEARKT